MKLNSLERVKRAVKHQKTDCVPVAPYMGNHGAKVAGVKLRDYYTNGKIMADAQYKAWEIYNQDMVVPQSDGYYIAEGFGCVTEYNENDTPTLKKTAIDDISQVMSLKLPDPYKDGRMSVYLEATQLLSQKLGGEVCVRSTGTGPFSLSGHIMGTQNFLMNIAQADYLEDKECEKYLFELMEISTQAAIDFIKAVIKAGANLVQCGDSLASIDMISPATYEKYVFPFEKKFFEGIEEIKTEHDVMSLLHICGDNTKIMNLLSQTGADIVELDYKVDLSYFKKNIGDKVCLMGNLNPAGALHTGTPDEVALEAKKCIEMAGLDSGFILGSGCEVTVDTPIENMKAMVRTARDYKFE